MFPSAKGIIEMMDNKKIFALHSAAMRLAELTKSGAAYPIGIALNCEKRNAAVLGNVRIIHKDLHGLSAQSREGTELLGRLREKLEQEFQAEGKAERDERLRAILAEIEALRGDICNAAADAQIEAGQIAREIREMLE